MINKILFLICFFYTTLLPLTTLSGQDVEENTRLEQNQVSYDSVVSQIHITPGLWRPMFGTEQIAWVSPPWSSQEYIWLDFPEAIFSGKELLFLSHINPRFPSRNQHVESVPWQRKEDGIRYEQELSNGIRFGGSVTKKCQNIISLELWMQNGSNDPVKDVKLQTCAYLHGIEEFNQMSSENKLVHVAGQGWIPYTEALELADVKGKYHVGWLSGPEVADLPVILALSKEPERLVAFTWFENTYSFIGNQNHPCFHADPRMGDIEPGESKTISGELIFFEGTTDEFEEFYRTNY